MTEWIDIKEIERRICGMVGGAVGRVYLNNAPRAVADAADSFAVVELGSRIEDYNAYKRTELYIHLYVRERRSSVEDADAIHEISNRVLGLLPYSDGKMSILSPEVTYGGRLDTLSVTVIGCDLIIK